MKCFAYVHPERREPLERATVPLSPSRASLPSTAVVGRFVLGKRINEPRHAQGSNEWVRVGRECIKHETAHPFNYFTPS